MFGHEAVRSVFPTLLHNGGGKAAEYRAGVGQYSKDIFRRGLEIQTSWNYSYMLQNITVTSVVFSIIKTCRKKIFLSVDHKNRQQSAPLDNGDDFFPPYRCPLERFWKCKSWVSVDLLNQKLEGRTYSLCLEYFIGEKDTLKFESNCWKII